MRLKSEFAIRRMKTYKTPYWYQQEAINAALYSFSQGERRILIVAPTGSGKSVIIACFCEQVTKKWPGTKILVISDTIEILKQNHQALIEQLPELGIGLYSAGVGCKTLDKITVAGIQSIYKKTELFSEFDLILVDEAHSVSFDPKTRYRLFLDKLNKPTIGLTATPFRLKGGYLYTGENSFFKHKAYEIRIPILQKEGKLCSLITQGTENKMDASKIKQQEGDFIISELSLAFDREEITKKIIQELIKYKEKRKKWLGFAIDINHCVHITEQLTNSGVAVAALHSKLTPYARNKIIKNFREGKLQALVSISMVITGFDVKDIDLIFLMRPTTSPSRHIQMIGRGLRTAEGKKDCLCLDFAENLIRNGPIDDPKIKDNEFCLKGSGEALMKECPKCLLICPIATRICGCGYHFPFKHHLTSFSSDAEIISTQEWHKVQFVDYFVKINKKGIPCLIVRYYCGLRSFSEVVCFEHEGFAKFSAHHWWKRRWSLPNVFVPATCEEAKKHSNFLKKPSEIKVREGGKYPTIQECLI